MTSFTRLDILKSAFPQYQPFYTQGWIYAGLASYYGQQGKFDRLEFCDQIHDTIVRDYSGFDTVVIPGHRYGLVFEGHVDYWFPNPASMPHGRLISGHAHHQNWSQNTVSVGFDFWDHHVHSLFSLPSLQSQINHQSVSAAEYDVVIPVGEPRAHRLMFLQELEQQRQSLTIVTDDTQTVLTTPLRFSNLGIEVYLNKFGLDRFQPKTQLQSFFDTNLSRSLDHLPHAQMHSIARVNVALETTVYNHTEHAYLTEKTWKILAQARPFVIFGDVGSLDKLRKQGFRTFGNYCDESYDKETNTTKRAIAAIQALHQLVKATRRAPDEIDQVCKHNQQWYFTTQRLTRDLAQFGERCLTYIFN